MITSLYLGADQSTISVNLEYIKKYGAISCTVLSDPEKALAYLKKNRTDLVFVEQHELFIDAMSFFKQARQQNIYSEFIIITAEYNPELISGMYLSGVFEVLAKPFDYDTFSEVISNYEEQISKIANRRVSEGSSIFRNSIFAKKGSNLENRILKRLENEVLSAGELSKKLKEPQFIVNQCLNRLVAGGMLTTYVKEFDGIPRRVYFLKND